MGPAQRSAGSAPAASPLDSYLARRATTGAGQVQRLPVYWKGPSIRKPIDGDEPEQIVETRTLDRARRAELVRTLTGQNNALLEEIQEEWEEKKPELNTLLALAAEIDGLERVGAARLNEPQATRAVAILNELNEISASVINLKEDEAQTMRDTVRPLWVRAEALWSGSAFKEKIKAVQPRGGGVEVAAEDFTAQEIADYREDMRQLGVWGGLAEAERAAAVLNLHLDVYNLTADETYRRVARVRNGGGNRALLHLGNHYEVVQNIAEGDEHEEGDIIAATEADGNCLFEALLIARAGRKIVNPETRERSILGLREAVAENLSEDQIRTSLLQINAFGETGGLGPRTAGHLRSRLLSPDRVKNQLDTSSIPAEKYEKYLELYKEAWKKDPTSEEAASYLELIRGLDVTQGKGKYITGAFAKGAPPEGILPPVIWGNNKVGIKFDIAATFEPAIHVDKVSGKSWVGEYRQEIRGYFGSNQFETDHTLAYGKKLSAEDFQEDGNGNQPPYGHRDTPGSHDKYRDADGKSFYSGTDSPSTSVAPGEEVIIWLDFVGKLVEVEIEGSKRKVVGTIAQRSWSVRGKAVSPRRGEVQLIRFDEEPVKKEPKKKEPKKAEPVAEPKKKKKAEPKKKGGGPPKGGKSNKG